jgi:catechol 2,3-dioxygenase-like lactoylglutathione lyase family enzyme
MSVINHAGNCVTDLDRSIRFYTEVFGFEFERRLQVPDSPSDRLLRIEPPVGLTAVYLRKDQFTLELLHFDRPGNPAARERLMNEPGFTHLSFSVDDVPGTASKAAELGGEIVAGTDVGAAVFIRDPDGQLLELLPMSYRRAIQG